MKVYHRGHVLSDAQLEILKPILIQSANEGLSLKKTLRKADEALEAAGMPVPAEVPKPIK